MLYIISLIGIIYRMIGCDSHIKNPPESLSRDGETEDENNAKMKATLANHLLNSNTTESGLIIVDIVKGDGDEAIAGKEVTVNYTGTL